VDEGWGGGGGGGAIAKNQVEMLELIREFYTAGHDFKSFYLSEKLSGVSEAKGLLAVIVRIPPLSTTPSPPTSSCLHTQIPCICNN